MKPTRHLSPITLGLVLASLLWGANFSVMKAALDELDPLAFNALRFPLAALALLVIVHWRGRKLLPPSPKEWWRVAALGLVGHLAYQLFFLFGIELTLAGNASLLIATTPVWVVLLSVLFRKERFSPLILVGATVALVGTAVLILGVGDAGSGGSRKGDLLVLVSALMWAFYTVFARRLIKRHGALEVTAWTLWIGAPALFLAGVPSLLATDWGAVSAGSWLGVVYAGVLAVSVCYFLWYRGVQRLGQSRTAIYANFVPVCALLVAWAWLDEVPGELQLTGAVIIFAGIAVAAKAPRMRAGDRARRRARREATAGRDASGPPQG